MEITKKNVTLWEIHGVMVFRAGKADKSISVTLPCYNESLDEGGGKGTLKKKEEATMRMTSGDPFLWVSAPKP